MDQNELRPVDAAARSFELDPFQKEALGYIGENHSVLVSAPTGAGKTLIAEAAIDHALAAGMHAIYTAPIKALSNQKFRDFRERYGEEKVGILTGDVTLNSDAPILIMTTEIYRNSLFEISERIQRVGWIIFDEIHYLDDPERGTVWEEAILFTPKNIRILALSATCPNIADLAVWMEEIHDRPVAVIEETHRPVPLEFVFQCQGDFHRSKRNLLRFGYLTRENWRLSRAEKRRGLRPLRARPNRLDQMLKKLEKEDHLPMIYFAFGRQRTERLAWEAAGFQFLSGIESKKVKAMFEELLESYDLTAERSALDMAPLVENGIAFHHAGMLPSLKEVIERLFTSRLIKVIFTTETFALGINMPARTVVFDELEKYYGTGFRQLTTRDFFQMAGRAGRRGMDDKGHVYIRVQPNHIAYPELLKIIYGGAEPIRSQLNATYATLLNLYRQLGEKLLEIYPLSFHHWQSSQKRRKKGLSSIERKLDLLRELECIQDGKLTVKGEFTASLFGYELILAEMYAENVLDSMDEDELCVLISGLIFEPRRGDRPPRLSTRHSAIQDQADHFYRRIHRVESKHRVFPYTKPPHLNLARPVEGWYRGCSFDDLFKMTTVDEGTIVRHLRMIIQLLRELAHADHTPPDLKKRANRAIDRLNRDVVDAEKQLRT